MSQLLSAIHQNVPEEVRPLLQRQFESWQQGTRVNVETMIQSARPEHRAVAAQALIKQEIALREQSGEHPQIAEYRSRFPEYAEKLAPGWQSEPDVTLCSNPDIPTAPPTVVTQMDTNSQLFEATFVSTPGKSITGSGSGAPTHAGGRTMPAAEVGDPVNELIGPYRLTKKLGQGGMGAVYQAVHTKLDKVVAIKLLSPQSGLEAVAVERFEREMKAVGKLEHINIVRAMDAGEADGYHFLVMEYVEGRDVSQWVKARGPFSVGQACEIIRQSALGLHEAHSLGLVHRDIKPSNLFLTSKGVVKILDLGLARLAEGTFNHELTQSGQCMGTPDYMAPEQWTNARDVDGRTDLYALGCTLFHLMTGRPPYGTSEHESLGSKVLAHTSGAIPDIRQLRPDLPADVQRILECLLNKDRKLRFATGGELAQALQPFCEPLPGSDSVSVSDMSVVSMIPRKPKSGVALRVGAIAVCLTLVAASAFIYIRVRDKYGRVTEMKIPAGSTVQVVDANGTPLKTASPSTTATTTTTAAVAANTAQKPKTGQASVTVRPIPAGELPEMQPEKVGSEPTVAAKPEAVAAVTPVAPPADGPPMPPTKGEPAGDKPAAVVALNTEPKDPPAIEELVPTISIRLPLAPDLIAKQQGAWSRRLGRPTTQPNSIGLTLVVVPPGEFDMGSTSDEQGGVGPGGGASASIPQLLTSEGPRHRVKISRPFAMGQAEVTVGQFREFVTATQYKTLAEREAATGLSLGEGLSAKQRGRQPTYSWQYAGDLHQDDEQPVCNLSWYDAVAFCEWLSQKERATYRLPTEAEWEYVARAGLGVTAFGSDEWNAQIKQGANLADASAVREFGSLHLTNAAVEWDDTFATVAPIGKFAPNVLGLQDLVGNVAELCSDRFASEYYQVSPLENPRGPDAGIHRVVRGASWQSSLSECRPGMRGFVAPRQAQMQVGFRVVMELQEPLEAGATAPADTPVRREQQVAEWVLNLGGKLRVSFGKDYSNEISKLSDLPKRDFTVYAISLADTGISDVGLVRLKGLTQLQELDLSASSVTDYGLETLIPHKNLKKLNLQRTSVTGAGLVHIIGAKKLAELDLSRSQVTDASLDPVKGLVSLTILRLNSTAVTDEGLAAVKPLINLKELHLADTRVTGSGLTNLKYMEQLTLLDLSQTPINNNQMQSISLLKKLRILRLNWSTVGDLGLAHLKENYILNEVGLRGTEATDYNVEMLGRLRGMKTLDLRETDFTASGVEEMKKTLKATKIEMTVGDYNARVASLCLSAGGQLVIAHDVNDANTKTISDIKELPAGSFIIREIELTDQPVGDGWLWMLPRLQGLKVLKLNGTRIDDAGLEVIAKAEKLESLSLDGTRISEAGLDHLAGLKQLKTLSMRDTRIPAAQILGLRQKLMTTEIQ